MKVDKIEMHLKNLWSPKFSEKTGKTTFKRSKQYIVPNISWDEEAGGALNNDEWAYCVPYCFRDALDLRFDTLYKDKKPYKSWTQGHRINFKEGDLLASSKGFPALQVKSSTAMDWDGENNKMFEGVVNYEVFENVKFGHIGDVKTVSQMEFLNILVCGQM